MYMHREVTMAKKKVCDFCLSEASGLFSGFERLSDNHYICRNCKSILKTYGLPVKYGIFQCLVTAQDNMTDTIMNTWLENHDPVEVMNDCFPEPSVSMHEGEKCINAFKASITVQKADIPAEQAVRNISEVKRSLISDIPSSETRSQSQKVEGMLYETNVALYFLSDHFINCHRPGYIVKDGPDTDRITVVTPKKQFVYMVDHADMFFLRERFYQKVYAALHNKDTHLIYIRNENEVTVTPGIYNIPNVLKAGIYEVTAINNKGLHVRDALGRVRDYTESDVSIDLSDGGVLECTGEYKLKWIGEK